jgi:hypothetical protein
MKQNTGLKYKLGALAIACGVQCTGAAIDYVRDVRPILAKKCFVCHGPAQQIAGLRLDVKVQRQAALQDGEHGELVRRITSTDPSLRMPPWPTALGVSPQEIEVLRKWAAEGVAGDDPAPPGAAAAALLSAIDRDNAAQVRLMLKDRKLVNARDSDGSSPLMHAALSSDLEVVKLLLQRGADPKLANHEGATARSSGPSTTSPKSSCFLPRAPM